MLDLILGNEARQMADVLVGEHFGDCDHNMVQFKFVMDKEIDKLQKKVLDWGRVDFNKIRQYLAKVDWNKLLVGKSMPQQWGCSKMKWGGYRPNMFPLG